MDTEFSAVLIAQLMEYPPCKWMVLCSSPSWGDTFSAHTQNEYIVTKIHRGKHISSEVKFGIYYGSLGPIKINKLKVVWDKQERKPA